MKRSLLVQTLLDMATGSGGAKLEALVVDAAGTFDAGSGKGYNPVTVLSGTINVLGEKGVVSNNSVVVTPKAQVGGGWVDGGETTGTGVSVSASELVSGTLNVSQAGTSDVTNYEEISVPSGSHSASATKGVVSNHSVTVTPKSTATAGFVSAGDVTGTGVSVSASELVSGTLNINSSGDYDVTNYAIARVALTGNSCASTTFLGALNLNTVTIEFAGLNFNVTPYKALFILLNTAVTNTNPRQLYIMAVGPDITDSRVIYRAATTGDSFLGNNTGWTVSVVDNNKLQVVLPDPAYYSPNANGYTAFVIY